MKIVIDNNIMLDALLKREPFNILSEKVLLQCAEKCSGRLSANSLTDIFFVLKKVTGSKAAKAAIKNMIELFEIISITEEDCVNAISLPIDDFEDALIVTCAIKSNADFIVTRDESLLKMNIPVRVVSPRGFIEKLA